MKKMTKIFFLMILILLFFGITTSNADTIDVYKSTSINTIVNALVEGKGIILKQGYQTYYSHSNVFCRQKGGALGVGDATYTLDKEQGTEGEVVYPDSDIDGNGYAIAYVFAYGKEKGYSKLNMQKAYWNLLGQYKGSLSGGAKTLYTKATNYQNFKIDENKFLKNNNNQNIVVNKDGAKSQIDGEYLIYGPIQISCTYRDGFGGFNYSFAKDGVQLCAFNGTKYTNISTHQNDYINEDLYVRFKYENINASEIEMTITYNGIDAKATIYQIKGEQTVKEYLYCLDCKTKMTQAKHYESNGMISTDGLEYCINNNDKEQLFEYDGNYYYYSGNSERANNGNEIIWNASETLYVKYSRYSLDGILLKGGINSASLECLDYSFYCMSCSTLMHARTSTKHIRLRSYSSHQMASNALADHFWDKHISDTETSYKACSFCGSAEFRDTNPEQKTNEINYHFFGTYGCKNANGVPYVGVVGIYNVDNTSELYQYQFNKWGPCGDEITDGDGNYLTKCGSYINKTINTQRLSVLYEQEYKTESLKIDPVMIPVTISIDVTKEWEDYSNQYEIRPENITLKVYRTTDKVTWTELSSNEYSISWEPKAGNSWKAVVSNLLRVDSNGNNYFYKVEEQIQNYYDASYLNGNVVSNDGNQAITIKNTLKKIDISGYVWEDKEKGIKPVEAPNGKMDDNTKMQNIVVHLYYKNPTNGTISKVAETKTNENGYYEFLEREIGYYYVQFQYDGINYEDTIAGGDSKAFELDLDRNTFNGRFQTITQGKSNDGTVLNYNYGNGKSTLITTQNGNVKQEFIINAATSLTLYTGNAENLNLGLVKRGVDFALSTDVSSAKVTINGEETNYTYNKEDNTVEIGTTQTSEKVSYNLNLYASDYNYRIRNYVSNNKFTEKNYVNEQDPQEITTGEELDVYVTYEVNLQNQSNKKGYINTLKYQYDEKYDFVQENVEGITYTVDTANRIITINLNKLELTQGQTKTIYLKFKVKENESVVSLGDFSNKVEITSYSTDEGLIDKDSQPDNFLTKGQVEDDNDTAGGLTIKVEKNIIRNITGKVFDNNNQNVNDVIVQLIELKTVNGKVYEYIWQETVSGTGKGKKLNATGTDLEEYTYTKADGQYLFTGFIPGDYIVRFIYGDGTTYDLTGNVIKYNGQDYKSVVDTKYNSEWYNSSSYTAGASVARDNEARRLETMTYSVEIDAEKGVLLKLLNNVKASELNETEKEILIVAYNKRFDPDITEITDDVITKLLKEEVLKNTWMCAETSKIKVTVDNATETIQNSGVPENVSVGTSYENINLGLELRPVTKIELKKYITGFKLIAANGQTLVNAYITIDKYLDGTADSKDVLGVKDNMITILDTVWQYEVIPTEINTVVDGANLEFEYTLVAKNIGDTDYLSAELANAYKTMSIADYKTLLTNKKTEIKATMKNGTYNAQIGKTLGNSYYIGGTNGAKVLTEVTNIRDYINNDLTFVLSGNVAIDTEAPHIHRILRDDYTMQEATIKTILKITETTGKMTNDTTGIKMYKVTLGKNPISSTGNLNFENYIAEVMSFTNAAGRRTMDSTPGNAEIIDHEYRKDSNGNQLQHEIDEADTARIQIGVATGEDEKTNYIIIIAVIVGIAVIATGAFVIKKYVIK